MSRVTVVAKSSPAIPRRSQGGLKVGVRVWAELLPTRKPEKLLTRARQLLEYADALDIPDGPLGVPLPSAPLLACRLAELGDMVPHLRVVDHSELGLASIALGLEACGVERLLLLRGDPPRLGAECRSLSAEDAASLLRRAGVRLRLGALLSLRKPLEAILSRVRAGFDFLLATRAAPGEKLEVVSREARSRGVELAAYVIIETPRNAEFLRRELAGQPTVKLGEVKRAVEDLGRYVDAVLLSAPGDHEGLLEALRIITQ